MACYTLLVLRLLAPGLWKKAGAKFADLKDAFLRERLSSRKFNCFANEPASAEKVAQ